MVRALVKITGCGSDIVNAIKPEEFSALSKAKVYQSDYTLMVEIETNEISDLRAAINSWLRLIKVCIELEEVLDDG
ncbi:MAG TPA: hypothetical protein ENG16_00835 [Archaeoglobus sp.]|nr:hypothetical protein [Archaeoglobus sp.]